MLDRVLLDLARYNEGRLRLRLSDVSLPDLCAECAIELSGWLAYESKTLILDVPRHSRQYALIAVYCAGLC